MVLNNDHINDFYKQHDVITMKLYYVVLNYYIMSLKHVLGGNKIIGPMLKCAQTVSKCPTCINLLSLRIVSAMNHRLWILVADLCRYVHCAGMCGYAQNIEDRYADR